MTDQNSLIINPDEVQRLKDNAKWNPIPLATLAWLAKGFGVAYGDKDDFSMIADPFMIVFTHEIQKIGICRHLSISIIDQSNKIPEPHIVKQVLKIFGFINNLEDLIIWVEEPKIKYNMAINLIEPLDGDMSKINTNIKNRRTK